MTDYKTLKKICDANTKMLGVVVDDFLLAYANNKHRVAKEFDSRLMPFVREVVELDESSINLLRAQYMGHRIFRKDGLINRYIDRPEIKRLPNDQQELLRHQLSHPWRFSFGIVLDIAAPDFFEMADVFTGERYTLYSKSMSKILETEGDMVMWFNLIANNGSCYQSFGPVTGYQSFDDDDVFFFASELNPAVTDDEELIRDVERNPVPYMLLVVGGRIPPVTNSNEDLVHCFAEYDLEQAPDFDQLKNDFTIEHSGKVSKLAFKGWDQIPHYATWYYDGRTNAIAIYAMTETGFDALTGKLRALGFSLDNIPQLRVHPSMMAIAQRLLRREVTLDQRAELFETPTEDDGQIDRVNALLASILPDVNAGRKIDIEKLAKEFDVDYELVKGVVEASMQRMKGMR